MISHSPLLKQRRVCLSVVLASTTLNITVSTGFFSLC